MECVFSIFIERVNSMSKRGRPAKFVGNAAKHVASLVRKHGGLATVAILGASARSERGQLRNQKLFPKPISVSVPTVCSVAADYGVELRRGRRVAA